MKKSKNGFMLVELIITSTIVVGAMIALYASFNRIYTLYQRKNSYYTIDGTYATNKMLTSLMNNNLNQFINTNLEENSYTYLIKQGSCKLPSTSPNYAMCTAIIDLYDIKNMILAEYDKCILSPTSCNASNGLSVENQTFKEYIDYIIGYYDIVESDTSSSYILLTEIEENQNTYYANLRIR